MALSSSTSNRSGRERDRREQPDANGRNGRSTTHALRAIVRRILRTQSSRTQLEKRVCREAQRINDGGFAGMSRETVVGLIVDKLQQQLRGRSIAGPATGAESVRFESSGTIAVTKGDRR